jgi:hypothetical protein
VITAVHARAAPIAATRIRLLKAMNASPPR